MNPIFDLWGGYMLDLQILWLLGLPIFLLATGISSLFKRRGKR
jgi:hypothetical protein